jgi:hypothetical protein
MASRGWADANGTNRRRDRGGPAARGSRCLTNLSRTSELTSQIAVPDIILLGRATYKEMHLHIKICDRSLCDAYLMVSTCSAVIVRPWAHAATKALSPRWSRAVATACS